MVLPLPTPGIAAVILLAEKYTYICLQHIMHLIDTTVKPLP